MLGRISLAVALMFGLSAFKVIDAPSKAKDEIAAERQAQANLPQSKSPLWRKLTQCKVTMDQKSGVYAIALTPEVRALAGKTVKVNGFVLPLDGSDKTMHFLVSKRTPDCMFCPPGDLNDVIEVWSKKAVNWGDGPITLKGRFGLATDGEKGVFFTLKDAETTASESPFSNP